MTMVHHIQTVFREGWRFRWERAKNAKDTYRTMEELCDLLGRGRPVSSIGIAEVNRLIIGWQGAGLSNARINRKVAVLRPLLRYAYDMGYTPAPPPAVKQLREGGGRERFLTRPEAEAILAHMPARYQPLVQLLLYTGARYGEAVALRWSDIGPDSVTFRWSTTKGGKTRTVPVSWALITMRPEPGEDGQPGPFASIDYDAFHTAFRRAVEASGIRDGREVVPHTLRHSCASWMAQAGVPIRHIQRWLGHSSVVTTERYAKLTQADLKIGLDALIGSSVYPSRVAQVRTGETLANPVKTGVYTMGECPERQRGRTVNPAKAEENQSFIDLYTEEELGST